MAEGVAERKERVTFVLHSVGGIMPGSVVVGNSVRW